MLLLLIGKEKKYLIIIYDFVLGFFCSSLSIRVRRLSSIGVSNYLIPLSIVLVGITQIPIVIYYRINSQSIICLGQPNLFKKFNGILILIL